MEDIGVFISLDPVYLQLQLILHATNQTRLCPIIMETKSMPANYDMSIDGQWVGDRDRMDVINPASEDVLATVPVATVADCHDAIDAAHRAQKPWARRTGVERGNVLRKLADLVDANRESLARLLSQEEGKPLAEARAEIDFGNSWLRYYAEFDRRIEGEIIPPDQPNEQMWIVPQPVGVVVGIIAWNFPFALAIRKIAPALIAGNTIVLKPHEDTPLTALELLKLAEQAELPRGVINIVTGRGEVVGDALVRSTVPQLITFTGNVATGKHIARVAADNVTTVSLEMGGKAPFIVMDDSDIEAAAKTAAVARFLNCGQVCICNERTYVQKSIAERFIECFQQEVTKIKIGDPLDETNTLGPKVNKQELVKVDQYVRKAVSQGAKLLTGGKVLSHGGYQRGYWYEPTILVDVDHSMDIMHKEVFGPVIPIMTFDDDAEAIDLANDTHYGLAGYLFSNDINRILRAVREMECGELYINRGPAESIHGFHSGWKQSGIGGDDGKHGLEHYLRRKTVYLKSVLSG